LVKMIVNCIVAILHHQALIPIPCTPPLVLLYGPWALWTDQGSKLELLLAVVERGFSRPSGHLEIVLANRGFRWLGGWGFWVCRKNQLLGQPGRFSSTSALLPGEDQCSPLLVRLERPTRTKRVRRLSRWPTWTQRPLSATGTNGELAKHFLGQLSLLSCVSAVPLCRVL
jgi:hypothetical protein